MPVSVARQIEYGLERYSGDIRLEPLILTAEQVRRYSLPRTPVKVEDKRKDNWQAINGAGAVELDALEALYPGEFALIVEEAVSAFRDVDLATSAVTIENEAQDGLELDIEERLGPQAEEVSAIRSGVSEVTARYEQRLEDLDRELQAELESYRERMEPVRRAIQLRMDAVDPYLPDLPEGYAAPDDDGWLFDSRRDYMDQLDAYKRRQRGEG